MRPLILNRAIQTCLLDLLGQFLRLGNIRLHEYNYFNSSLTVVKRQCEQRRNKPTTEIVPFCTIYVYSKRKRNDHLYWNCTAFLPVLNLAFLINLIYNKHFRTRSPRFLTKTNLCVFSWTIEQHWINYNELYGVLYCTFV